jgi:hypothetical protein
MINKAYLIVGGPGSGKTTLLRKLAPDAVTIDGMNERTSDTFRSLLKTVQPRCPICIDDADRCALNGVLKTMIDEVLEVSDVYIILQPNTLREVKLRWERYSEIYCMSDAIAGLIPEEYQHKVTICTHPGYLKRTFEVTTPFEGGVSVDIDEFIFGRKARVTVEVECTAKVVAQPQEPKHVPKKRGDPNDVTTCASAAGNGQLSRLREAHEDGYGWDSKTCSWAALNGHIDCLIYAHKNGCPWCFWACNNAAGAGNLDCLKYLHENGCEWNRQTCISAAMGGAIDCLIYAHENGCEWNEDVCISAAEVGNLDCLKYAHENGCPCNKWACERAAKKGNLDCLKYLHESGCPWGDDIANITASKGQEDCLKYLLKNGCRWD